MPEAVSKMRFPEFKKKIAGLKPMRRGFKKRAFSHFDKLFEKKFGLKDATLRKKVVNQVMDRMNAGDRLSEAVEDSGRAPHGFDEPTLKEYGDFFSKMCISEPLEYVRDSEEGVLHYPSESKMAPKTADVLLKEVFEHMGGDTSRARVTMAKAAVSQSVEGETINYNSLSHDYLGDLKVPDGVKGRIGDWLKTSKKLRPMKKN